MQQFIDCTMPCTPAARHWVKHWIEKLTDNKLRIRVVDVSDATDTSGLNTMLDIIRTHLQTSHLCILPICPENLSWSRTFLGQVARSLSVPVMAVTSHLKAIALHDLLTLGVADFIHTSACADELRVRIERALVQMRTAQLDALSKVLETAPHTVVSSNPVQQKPKCPNPHATIHAYSMGRLVSHATHRVTEMSKLQYRPNLAQHGKNIPLQHNLDAYQALELETFAAVTATRCALHNEPFKQAKSKVIEGFEKAYLVATLSRYGGNIAQAAKAAKKHRRAFWELIRKHHIDLSIYRAQGSEIPEPRA